MVVPSSQRKSFFLGIRFLTRNRKGPNKCHEQIVGIALGIASVAGWPTNTSVGTVFFGIALAVIFTIPTGIIFATTGIEVEFNVLAEFIGGAWQPGNALAVSY